MLLLLPNQIASLSSLPKNLQEETRLLPIVPQPLPKAKANVEFVSIGYKMKCASLAANVITNTIVVDASWKMLTT